MSRATAESYDGVCDPPPAATGVQRPDTENRETTNLTVADRWGNVVEYTLTIEQTGGAGLLVPNRGFLLNNELTDFSLAWTSTDPNRLEGGKRPRSSMSPTILTRNGRPFLALGSPGGASIITTVLQVILNRIDRDLPLPRSVREPRASQRNSRDRQRRAGVHQPVRPAAEAVRPQVRTPGGTGDVRRGDRRPDRDRVPRQPADDRGGRADPPWRWIGAGRRPASTGVGGPLGCVLARRRLDSTGTLILEFAHGRIEDLLCAVLKQCVHEDDVTPCQATLDDGADLIKVGAAREHQQG